jgi:glucan phosphoethanolaminetransferase (alkaline phosphatase superfamily)
MNSAIIRPRANPITTPADTPRTSTFCSPFVIWLSQKLREAYHNPRSNCNSAQKEKAAKVIKDVIVEKTPRNMEIHLPSRAGAEATKLATKESSSQNSPRTGGNEAEFYPNA